MGWNDYIQVFTTLFAIINPVGAVPLFLSFTENMQHKRKETARTAALAVSLILIVTVIVGEPVLHLFHISVDAFRVAGGILLLFIAFNMLQARRGRSRHTPEEDEDAIDSDSVAIVPLALPLLAGPGAISTTILYSHQMAGMGGKIALSVICALVACSVWISLHLAPQIAERMSRTAINIMMRVMGLILAAMSIEFIVNGLKNLLPGLAG